jgi:spore coat polysaccharide biosynthesis protein SpsF
MSPRVKAFIQARMSSRRYPGKVLAPFRGEPVIRHVVRAATTALPPHDVVVVTSTHCTDDPLVLYLQSLGVNVFRGPLDDVLQRFVLCLHDHPCEWVLRINGDSPLLWPELVRLFLRRAAQFQGDLITTIAPRTFPRGQNLELIRATALNALATKELTRDDTEHVTPYFYRNADRYRIENVESGDATLSETSVAVDTVDDLRRLEGITAAELQRVVPPVLSSTVLS